MPLVVVDVADTQKKCNPADQAKSADIFLLKMPAQTHKCNINPKEAWLTEHTHPDVVEAGAEAGSEAGAEAEVEAEAEAAAEAEAEAEAGVAWLVYVAEL